MTFGNSLNGTRSFIQEMLDSFHQQELEDRPKWCWKHIGRKCDECDHVWCAVHSEYINKEVK